jgi:hypothetical protein
MKLDIFTATETDKISDDHSRQLGPECICFGDILRLHHQIMTEQLVRYNILVEWRIIDMENILKLYVKSSSIRMTLK